MVKRVATDDKDHDANERRNHAQNETQQEKYESNIFIHDEKKKAHGIMEGTQFMMKESHANQRSRQRGVGLLMFYHNNQRQLEKNNHQMVVSHLQTEYSQKDINTK